MEELNKNIIPMLKNLIQEMELIQEREARKRAWVEIMDTLIEHQHILRNPKLRAAIEKKLEEFALLLGPDEDESRRVYNELVELVINYRNQDNLN
jgi:hypothetical protein